MVVNDVEVGPTAANKSSRSSGTLRAQCRKKSKARRVPFVIKRRPWSGWVKTESLKSRDDPRAHLSYA